MKRARRFIGHAIAAPGANTNFVTAFTPTHPHAVLEIEISLATASILDLRVTDGTDAYSQALNEGNALQAGARYLFSVAAPRTSSVGGTTLLTYSLRVRTDGVIQDCIVDETSDR